METCRGNTARRWVLIPPHARKLPGSGVGSQYHLLRSAKNILAGAKEIAGYLIRYGGNLQLALAAYNAGPGNVEKYGNTVPPFRETRDYVVKVTIYYKEFGGKGSHLNSVSIRDTIMSVAEKLAKFRSQHEASVKQKKPTGCMKALAAKQVAQIKSGQAGRYGALSCAIYSYQSDWAFVAKVENMAAEFKNNSGTITYAASLKVPADVYPGQSMVRYPLRLDHDGAVTMTGLILRHPWVHRCMPQQTVLSSSPERPAGMDG
ncbi:lytic transglycosylase domain-containing protein [Polycladomyces subterraneus]|uniref:lytic transglycosylase domain-containing protein n=1 Tax=Polycladomyces subterraneus TaxID=1016997 RepID=UPI00263AE19F|nr:lytic transglycosylase domain-containing protein [Polycladomyces subterraneus]